MVFHQVKYLVNGNILPLSIPSLKVSNRLFLETVWGDGFNDASIGKMGHIVAYVGVESQKNDWREHKEYCH